MGPVHLIRAATRRRGLATAALAAALLTAMAGTAWAQEASDSTEIDIAVWPSGQMPTPPPGLGQPPAEDPAPPPPPGESRPIILAPAPPVLGARQAPAPGTVSAQVALVQTHGASDRPDDSVATLVVRDDRGTGAGWDVVLASEAPEDEEWLPVVLENRHATIRRLLPLNGQTPDIVSGGRVLGPFEVPLPLLEALPGNGSGVYQQPLIVAVPVFDGESQSGFVLIQLPFAP